MFVFLEEGYYGILVPNTLNNLSSLLIFNVSFNTLNICIPTSSQFAMGVFSNASYFPRNDGLCGQVTSPSCTNSFVPHGVELQVSHKFKPIPFKEMIVFCWDF